MSLVRQSYPDGSCFGFPACESVGNVGNEGRQRAHMLFLFIAFAVVVSAWLPAGALLGCFILAATTVLFLPALGGHRGGVPGQHSFRGR